MTLQVTPENDAPRGIVAWLVRRCAPVAGLLLLAQRGAGALLWLVLGLWTALVVGFWAPGGLVVRVVLAACVMGVFVVACRERTLQGVALSPWREQRWTIASAGVAVVVWGLYLPLVRPDPDTAWALDQSRHPVVSIEGDLAHVDNVRNFVWRSDTDYDAHWERRTYDLAKIERMYYVIAPLGSVDGLAHVLVSFGFSDGQTVAVSVEGRRPLGVAYRVIPSMFRQYQLVYIVGEERDVIGLRGAIWQTPVRFYPATSSPERTRAIFESMLRTGAALADEPEFYHLMANNCLTNITRHIRELGDHSLPSDYSMLMTGWTDFVAYELGYIDTTLPFDEARQAYRVDGWMQTAPLDETFSAALREHVRESEVR